MTFPVLVRKAQQRLDEIASGVLTADGVSLTPRQLLVLETLSATAPLSQTDIVEKTMIDRSTLADIVQRLLRRGLIVRKPSKQDARAYDVSISEAGRSLLNNLQPEYQKSMRAALSTIPEHDIAAATRALEAIVNLK